MSACARTLTVGCTEQDKMSTTGNRITSIVAMEMALFLSATLYLCVSVVTIVRYLCDNYITLHYNAEVIFGVL